MGQLGLEVNDGKCLPIIGKFLGNGGGMVTLLLLLALVQFSV